MRSARLAPNDAGDEIGQLLGDRCRGMRVSFDRVDHDVEAHAVNVTAVPIFAERRARSRGRR